MTIGLDLGDRISDYCILDPGTGEVTEGRLETTSPAFEAFFREYPGVRVVFEVGTHSRWVQGLLRQLGLEAIAADPRQLALISKSGKKNDRGDARTLAMAGTGLLELVNPVEHRAPQAHADLALLRSRDHLVRQRTALVVRIRGLVKSVGGRITPCDAEYFFRKARGQVPEEIELACRPLFAILEALHEEIRKIDKEVLEITRARYPIVESLMAVDRVGILTALTFVLTIEDPSRIRRNRYVGAYLGLVPRLHESGSCKHQLGISKAGDKAMRRLLILCAHQVLTRGKECHLRRWGLKLCERGGKNARKRAVVAIARKLAVLLLALWRNGKPYDPMRNVRLPEPEAAVA